MTKEQLIEILDTRPTWQEIAAKFGYTSVGSVRAAASRFGLTEYAKQRVRKEQKVMTKENKLRKKTWNNGYYLMEPAAELEEETNPLLIVDLDKGVIFDRTEEVMGTWK